jgi:uncharacterized protein
MKYTVILSILAIESVNAASFDCQKAATLVEDAVCSNPTLSELDDILAKNYRALLSSNIGKDADQRLKNTQRGWLKDRDRCRSEACIEAKYRERIDALCEYPVVSGVNWGCSDTSPQATAQPDFVQLKNLQGWWRFQDVALGCNDSDNQARVAIGSWSYDNARGEVVFDDTSEPRIGFYESVCSIAEGTYDHGNLVFSSSCTSEGQKSQGPTKIVVISADEIKLQTPVTAQTHLIRCPIQPQAHLDYEPDSPNGSQPRLHKGAATPASSEDATPFVQKDYSPYSQSLDPDYERNGVDVLDDPALDTLAESFGAFPTPCENKEVTNSVVNQYRLMFDNAFTNPTYQITGVHTIEQNATSAICALQLAIDSPFEGRSNVMTMRQTWLITYTTYKGNDGYDVTTTGEEQIGVMIK